MREILERPPGNIYTISLDAQRDQDKGPNMSYERALRYLEKITRDKQRITFESSPSLSRFYREEGESSIYSQLVGRFGEKLTGQYSLIHIVPEINQRDISKKDIREATLLLNIQKFNDAFEAGVISEYSNGLLNVVSRRNNREERTEQLCIMDQMYAFLKRYEGIEQWPKDKKRKLLTDSYINFWVGMDGSIEEITRVAFSIEGNKFSNTTVLY